MEYYSSVCRNCHCDCDSEFCSEECKFEWESGYSEYLYEQAKDRQLMEE